MERRLISIGLLAVALGLIYYALAYAPFWSATLDDVPLAIGVMKVFGEPQLDPDVNIWILLPFLIANYYLLARLCFFFFVTVLGKSPGSSVRKVAWLTPTRAYVQTGLVLLLAFPCALMIPELKDKLTRTTIDEIELTRSWGGLALLAGYGLALAAIRFVAITPSLAQIHLWDADELEAVEKPVKPKSRPMIKPPLAPPPIAVDSDPFRIPAPPRPSAPLVTLEIPKAPPVRPSAQGSDSGPSFLT